MQADAKAAMAVKNAAKEAKAVAAAAAAAEAETRRLEAEAAAAAEEQRLKDAADAEARRKAILDEARRKAAAAATAAAAAPKQPSPKKGNTPSPTTAATPAAAPAAAPAVAPAVAPAAAPKAAAGGGATGAGPTAAERRRSITELTPPLSQIGQAFLALPLPTKTAAIPILQELQAEFAKLPDEASVPSQNVALLNRLLALEPELSTQFRGATKIPRAKQFVDAFLQKNKRG